VGQQIYIKKKEFSKDGSLGNSLKNRPQ